jgi:hypothetical protein
MSRPVIRVGRTTTILGERFIAHNAPHMPREEQAAWWPRPIGV